MSCVIKGTVHPQIIKYIFFHSDCFRCELQSLGDTSCRDVWLLSNTMKQDGAQYISTQQQCHHHGDQIHRPACEQFNGRTTYFLLIDTAQKEEVYIKSWMTRWCL